MPSRTQSADHLLNPRRQRPDAAPSRPTIRTGAFRPDPSCTAAATEISIAPADRAAPFSRGFLPWRLSNAGPAAVVRVASTVMGPASETRHNTRHNTGRSPHDQAASARYAIVLELVPLKRGTDASIGAGR